MFYLGMRGTFLFFSECGPAQYSLLLLVFHSCCSRYVAFVELIHLEDLLDDVTFLFLTNQKPRKNLHTDGLTNIQKSDLYSEVALAKKNCTTLNNDNYLMTGSDICICVWGTLDSGDYIIVWGQVWSNLIS